MSGWAARRVWSDVEVVPEAGGFGLRLDARSLRTPAKAPLVVPTHPLAEMLADEWRTVEEMIDPRAMPVTQAANSAIDKVAPQREAVATEIAGYGDSDLVCYRADEPDALVARQAEAWDPLIAWAEVAHRARLRPFTGVMHRPQEPQALDRLAAPLMGADAFALTALSELVSLSGSLVIGLAAVSGDWETADLWERSRIDEAWQEGIWGRDEEAAEAAELRRRDFLRARRFHALATGAQTA